MYICQIKPYVFPRINLFNTVSVDDCIHFRRTPEEYIAFYIVKGDMYLMENQIHYHLKEGDWILLEPGKEHNGYKVSEHCTYFYIHFHFDGLIGTDINEQTLHELLKHNKMEALQGKNITDHIIIPKLCHSQSHMAYETILHLLNRGKQYFTAYKEFSDLQTSCLLLDLLVHLSHIFSNQILSNDDRTIKRSTFIVYDLLREINYNYGEKFSSRLIEKTIAQRVGYDDIYYFSNVFKKEAGLSPTQYRKTILEN